MGKDNLSALEQQLLPPSGARPQRRKTFKHDNTFAPSGGLHVGAAPRTTRFSDYDFDEYEHKYTQNKNFAGSSDTGPHIKGVHSYIFSDNKKDYTHNNYGSSFSGNKYHPITRRVWDYDDTDDLDFGLSKAYSSHAAVGSRRGPSVYDSKVSSQSTLYQSAVPPVSRTPLYNSYSSSYNRRSSPVTSTPTILRRSAPVSASPSYIRRSPSPSPIRRTHVSPSYYRRSPSPTPVVPSPSLYRRSPSPISTTIYRSSSSSVSQSTPIVQRRTSPSPVRRSFASHVSAASLPQRRASFAYASPTPLRRPSFSYPSPTPHRRASFSYPSPTPLRRSSIVSLSSAVPATPPPASHHVPVSASLRRHSITATSSYPLRRVPYPPSSTSASTVTSGTFTQHGPVFAKKFPERYTLIKTTLKPVYKDIEKDIPIEFEDTSIVPYIPRVPRYFDRRHSLDAGLARMGVDYTGAMDVYRERAITTTTTMTRPRSRSVSRPPQFRPRYPLITRPEYIETEFHPRQQPITRPETIEKASPLYDVDMYWITRQQLLEQPDLTSKFTPLKNRLNQIGSHQIGMHHPPASKIMVSPVSRPGEIPHFTEDFVPYEPMYRSPKVRPGGPLYVHSVGEDPHLLSHSELEPNRKDGVVCVMVVRGHTGGGGGTHSYHHVSSRVTGGSSGGDSYSLPLSAHSLGSSSLAGSAGYGYGGYGSGLGHAGAGSYTPSHHRIPDFLDLAEPEIASHVRPYVPIRGGAGHGGAGAGAGGGYRPHHGAGGAGLGGHVPYIPTHTAGHHVPVHASPYHSAPSYGGPGSYGGGGGHGHPYHHSPVALGDDTYLSPHRGRLPRETRASSMPASGGGVPLEHFKGTPRSWEPAKPREVPAGNFTASRPPRHVEPPVSDVRRRARDVICKTRNDPNYYNF